MSDEDPGKLVKSYTIYLIILIIFTSMIFFFVQRNMYGASAVSDVYSKEIVREINLGSPGQEIKINVQDATGIAIKNNVKNLKTAFSVDNDLNEICVKLSPNSKSCYSFFNEINVSLDLKLGVPENILIITLEDKDE